MIRLIANLPVIDFFRGMVDAIAVSYSTASSNATLPVTLVSLGLFILVINALLFWLVSHLVAGFHVAGFWSAFLAAILYSVISWALSTLLLNKDGNP